MPLTIDNFNQQLSRLKNSDALYIRNGNNLKSAGFWGKLFHKQAKFTDAVNTFCNTLGREYGTEEIGQLTRNILSLTGSNKLTVGTAKIIMLLANHIRDIDPTPDKLRLILDTLMPCIDAGITPSGSYIKSLLDIVNDKPLTLLSGLNVSTDPQIGRQMKLDVFRALFNPTSTTEAIWTTSPRELNFLCALSKSPEIKAKYPHGHITRAMIYEAKLRTVLPQGAKLPKFSAKELNKLTAEQFVERLKLIEDNFTDEHWSQDPDFVDKNSIMAGSGKTGNLYCTFAAFFSLRKIEEFASRALAEGEQFVLTQKDMLYDYQANQIIAGLNQQSSEYTNRDGSLNPQGLYDRVISDVERLGDNWPNCGQLFLTLHDSNGEPVKAEIGKPLCEENKAKGAKNSAGLLDSKCRQLLDKIGTKCRSQEQFVVVLMALTQCGSIMGNNLGQLSIGGSSGLSEHAPFSIDVSFDDDGTAHVHYELNESEKERHGELVCDFAFSPEGKILPTSFQWTALPHTQVN